MCCYNEIEYIPKCIRLYQQHDIDIVVFDNISTDGSWEWLNDNNIKCYQFDTNGCFYLQKQQESRLDYIKSKPEYDWIIYGDADEYITCKKPLMDIFDFADKNKCNIIKMKSFDIHNTGESRSEDITKDYFFYKERYGRFGGITRIHRNVPGVVYEGDFISVPNMKVCSIREGNILNYCIKF